MSCSVSVSTSHWRFHVTHPMDVVFLSWRIHLHKFFARHCKVETRFMVLQRALKYPNICLTFLYIISSCFRQSGGRFAHHEKNWGEFLILIYFKRLWLIPLLACGLVIHATCLHYKTTYSFVWFNAVFYKATWMYDRVKVHGLLYQNE